MSDVDLDLVQGLPVWHPPRDVLELVELVTTGALGALPEPLRVPDEVVDEAEGAAGILLEDAEGTPVAVIRRAGSPAGWVVEPVRPFAHGPLRGHRRVPAEVRFELGDAAAGTVLAVPVSGALTAHEVSAAVEHARAEGARLLWLTLVGHGRRRDLPPEALWRAVRAMVAELPVPGVAVPVALPVLADPGADAAAIAEVARALGASAVLPEAGRDATAETTLHRSSLRELAASVAPPARRGVTVFFTGLSGSGKSTVAKALAERIGERSTRAVSLLDGDEVRRLLSAGLGFSRADRDLNIRRIGYVATEVTRHRGLAICAPIAPFAQVRDEVRAAVEEVGDFVLVHVSTPLAVCERRDRKGLYARARAGEIPDFTGISSPYEQPEAPELRVDTTGITIEEAVDRVWALLARRGYVAG